MFPRIHWRQRALVWSALPVGGALLLAVACAPAPLPLTAHAAMTLAAPDTLITADRATMPMTNHAAMHMADHAVAPPASHAAHAGALMADGPDPARVVRLDARPAETAADSPSIDIQAFQYAASTLTVPVGTTVTWTNHDVEPHTVTANDRAFASPGLETNDTFAFRFDAPGTYAYHCALHPFMTGQIVVQ
ncbi:MAG TPA: cupredoxin family copper-binding protein [Chloroflexota bacterium]|nr:cupredoxin family copper-binding protein [Chloroflexota bacterium]